MIYLDASVAHAQLFGEGRSLPDGIWDGLLISSSLLEYEVVEPHTRPRLT